MLVLSRHRDEDVVIGNNVHVRIVDIRGDKVRLGIDAPRHMTVHRREVYVQVMARWKGAGRYSRGSNTAFALNRDEAVASLATDDVKAVSAIPEDKHRQAEALVADVFDNFDGKTRSEVLRDILTLLDE